MANAGESMLKKTMVYVGLGCALLGASGCVLGRNSDDPVLSVDLLWDESETSRFSEGTCESADVTWMEWKLKDDSGHVVRRNDKDATDCEPGFDFFDLDPGTYTLVVSGYDDQDKERWVSECTGLTMDRFDTLYECDIEQEVP